MELFLSLLFTTAEVVFTTALLEVDVVEVVVAALLEGITVDDDDGCIGSALS